MFLVLYGLHESSAGKKEIMIGINREKEFVGLRGMRIETGKEKYKKARCRKGKTNAFVKGLVHTCC